MSQYRDQQEQPAVAVSNPRAAAPAPDIPPPFEPSKAAPASGTHSRRTIMRAASIGVTTAAFAASAAAAEVSPTAAAAHAGKSVAPLAVTPSCTGDETPPLMEGPLFKPKSPERTNLVTPAVSLGVYLALHGMVYDTDCTPIPDCQIEFWQCDQYGDYDTAGYTLRGYQRTTARGGYQLETIIPRDYWGRWGQRAPHIHAQAQAPGGPVLITQLFFPDDTEAYDRDFAALNARDRLLNRACTLMLEKRQSGGYTGTFDFVITTKA
ncbi:dioxygenase family protein [Streptomyces avermitilis]|uniref:dioxygenase family protein n=1 Tax=Streptomyces avermitilis TaxID=33903 RepID=UPI0036BB2F06